jgi:parvulin-like peptidyl-prolyl isomerase
MVRTAGIVLFMVTILFAPTEPLRAEAPPSAPVDASAPRDPRREQVIAKGDGIEITLGEVEDVLAQQGPLARIRYRTADDLKALVETMVRTELLAREAKKRGYEANPAVQQTVKESAAQALVRLEVEDKITPQAIPVEEVRAYYDSHQAEFHRVAMRRASQIVLDSAAEAEQLLPAAGKADARGFAELAKQHSKHLESKQQAGDLGYFAEQPQTDGSEANVEPAVRAALFALKQVGDTSKPVALGSQYAIVRLTGERPARHASLEDAAPSIRAKLWRERRQQALDGLVAKLRARDKPQLFAKRVELISFDDMEKRPTGFAPDPIPVAVSADAAVGAAR